MRGVFIEVCRVNARHAVTNASQCDIGRTGSRNRTTFHLDAIHRGSARVVSGICVLSFTSRRGLCGACPLAGNRQNSGFPKVINQATK